MSDTPEGIDVQRIVEVIREHLGLNLPTIYIGYRGRRIAASDNPDTGFVTKPVTAEPLWREVAGVLGSRRSAR